MGTKRWIIPLALAAVLTAALAAALPGINGALADSGDITKSGSGPYNGENGMIHMTIDMDVQPHRVQSGGAQVQYTIDVRNIGADLRELGDFTEGRPSTNGFTAINVEIWATLPAGFTYASTDTIVEVGATRSSTDPSPGDHSPTWGYWAIQEGGRVTITFTANVPPGLPPGTYDANAFADGDNIDEINDDGPTGDDPDAPPGEDPEPDEDVIVGCTVGGIVEQVDTLELAAARGEPSDGGSMVVSLALGTGMAVLIAASLVWSLRKRRGIGEGKSQ